MNNRIDFIIFESDEIKIIKILISERYHDLKYKISVGREDEINQDVYKILEKLHIKINGKDDKK